MNSKPSYRLLFLSLILIAFLSCNDHKRLIEKIDFTTDYKFNQQIETETEQDTVPWKYQIAASDYASKGDYKNALIQWDMVMRGVDRNYTQSQIDSINEKYTAVKATDYIIEQAKNNQVVIINEAHHNSFHRAFTKSLLKDLYDEGYKNLGLEALFYEDDLDSLQNIRKYPVKNTGYYIKDPQFGNLIREAISIGYTIFPYESQNKKANGKPREIDQAKNIQKFIEAHPKEKFLIHCGFDHVLEGNHKSWEKAMAGRLTEYTDINPLTIYQVLYSERSKPEYAHPLSKAINLKESSVLIDREGNPFKYERGDAWADIVIFHPNTEYVDGRPNWLFKNGNKNATVNLDDIAIEFPVMVLAFKKGEDINRAVPIDITEVKSRTESCHLGLKKGSYEMIVTNGKVSFKFEQKVE